MYSPALVLISALSISVWSLGAAAAPLPYHVRSLSVRSFVDNDSGIQSRMVNDINILEQREGEFEAAAAAASEPPSSDHHHYTVQSLNAYLSTHRGHHHYHGANQNLKAKAPTTPGADTTHAAAESALAAPATEATPAPVTEAAAPADVPPVMRRAFHWDDMEDLD